MNGKWTVEDCLSSANYQLRWLGDKLADAHSALLDLAVRMDGEGDVHAASVRMVSDWLEYMADEECKPQLPRPEAGGVPVPVLGTADCTR